MENVKQQAAYDVFRAMGEVGGIAILRRHIGWFEPKYAADRGVTGKNRGRYQRAFHRALKARLKSGGVDGSA